MKVNLVRRLKDCWFYDTLNIGNSEGILNLVRRLKDCWFYDTLNIGNSEGILNLVRRLKDSLFYDTIQEPFHQSLVAIGPVVL